MLGERIAELRKARGMTQEQLGQLVGVSSQAVSKWEKGGTPDVELLPSIADRLEVSIDGLFGRDSAHREDMEALLRQWLTAFPEGERMNALFRLAAASIPSLAMIDNYVLGFSPDTQCYMQEPGEEHETIWMRSGIILEEGMVLGVLSREFPMLLLLPEPEAGYEAHFADNEIYRRLFFVLAEEGCLEILRYLYGQKPNYFTVCSIAKRTGLDAGAVSKVLADMEKCFLVRKKQVELEEGAVDIFMLHDNHAFVPLMYLARWLCEDIDVWAIGWEDRKRPILESGKAQEKNASTVKTAKKQPGGSTDER